jgi:hemerythrin-like domain-containing protein
MNPAMQLMRGEHEVVLRLLELNERLVERLVRTGQVPDADLRGVVRLMDRYVDEYHHAREERLLFTALKARGVDPREDPLLGEQHDRLRSLVRAMNAQVDGVLASDQVAIETLALVTREHGVGTREHIDLEERMLFPFAEKMLGPDACALLAAELERDTRSRRDGWLEELDRELDRLGELYGV